MKPKVSVIIPVYNAEQYLDECIDSLLNQTLDEIEMIIVNDGSIDKSQQIIESYCRTDSRVRLFYQLNQGVSAARNKGLQMALGKYAAFVDADDYIEPDMLQTLYSSAEEGKYDVVITNFANEIKGIKRITKYPFPMNLLLDRQFIEEKILPYLVGTDNFNSVCTKLYKTDIIQKHNIEFPLNVDLGEDGIFNMKFFSQAKKVMYIDYAGYNYREVFGSATRNIIEKDYFKRALEEYIQPLPEEVTKKINSDVITQLKSKKLINSIKAYIHIYFATGEIPFNRRYLYVKKMICHPLVQRALVSYLNSTAGIGRYERVLYLLINKKLTIGLYCITSYSQFRNRHAGGNTK
ncbi:glycosyltransferase [Metabacillus sp. GX 13764]|uniref:glycosyltransferase family 2 protein n=1 Tax=Metabacillus kandeliae TaxID=2900151 RepID=UPI001E39404E|nr:glycosyltransferase [Metabacillus kandeliae]MCD7033149.1 glycosyltransferase [Metabacillus kandeliae]